MAWYRCRHKGDGGVTPVGDATDGDVLSGKTYMNALGASTGTMPNRGAVSATLNTSTTSYTVPQGYHNGSGKVSITTQTKSATPSTSEQTISPDSGKVLSSVSISAISPQRSAGTAASASGRDNAGPYVYFPYGWWPNYSSSRNYTRLTEAQAIAVARTQEKTVTGSRSAQTVTPDSNYLLSKVTVNKYPDATGTFTPSSSQYNSSAADMGATNNYRYVNTAVCYSAGVTAGNAQTGAAQNVLLIPAGPGTSAKREFHFNNNLYVGNVYSFVIIAFQTGATGYSGVGIGAAVTTGNGATGLVGGGWSQYEVKSSHTGSNLGGMMMVSYGRFKATAASALIYANLVNSVGDNWLCYASGVFK